MISVLKMDSSGHVFSELNYSHKRNGVTWANGGLGDELENSGAIIGTANGNQTGTALLSYDATSFVQEYLRSGYGGDLDFIVIGRGLAGEEVEIATGDEPPSYRPHLSLTYSWGDSTPTAGSSLIAPLRGSAALSLIHI